METNKMSKTSSFVSKAYALQLQRIQEDEKIDAQEQLVRSDLKAKMNASWSDTLEEMAQNRIVKRLNGVIEQEMQLTNKALTKIRRARLQELLDNEYKEYRRELNELGLTFHKERK